MPSDNSNLYRARLAKNDEFYTLYSDIEKELMHYKSEFFRKIVYCNCDDSEKSNFVKFFRKNFDEFGLKKLICSCYRGGAHCCEYVDGKCSRRTLSRNGDFESDECLQMLTESDIIVTNPPFSRARNFVKMLFRSRKKFLFISNLTILFFEDVVERVRARDAWCGFHSGGMKFIKPDNTTQTLGNIIWLTNLESARKKPDIYLWKHYSPETHVKYDTFDAINCDKVKDIPTDYFGTIGVPVTFITKWNPDQFEIIRKLNRRTHKNLDFAIPIIHGKAIFTRILIKQKKK